MGAILAAFNLVTDFFEGDRQKAMAWWNAKNPLLGGLSAREMCFMGREDKVLKFVREALAENEPPDKEKR